MAMNLENELAKPIRELGCCCCGNSTRGRQWWNRDTGYGICPSCIEYVKKQGESDEQIAESYGVKGVHYDVEKEAPRRVHLTLSGGNGEPLAIRAVYADGEQIGVVRQDRENGLWIADDIKGHCHGVSYTTDWNAAKQLALGLGMRPE